MKYTGSIYVYDLSLAVAIKPNTFIISVGIAQVLFSRQFKLVIRKITARVQNANDSHGSRPMKSTHKTQATFLTQYYLHGRRYGA